jgi:hypothetical protein
LETCHLAEFCGHSAKLEVALPDTAPSLASTEGCDGADVPGQSGIRCSSSDFAQLGSAPTSLPRRCRAVTVSGTNWAVIRARRYIQPPRFSLFTFGRLVGHCWARARRLHCPCHRGLETRDIPCSKRAFGTQTGKMQSRRSLEDSPKGGWHSCVSQVSPQPTNFSGMVCVSSPAVVPRSCHSTRNPWPGRCQPPFYCDAGP